MSISQMSPRESRNSANDWFWNVKLYDEFILIKTIQMKEYFEIFIFYFENLKRKINHKENQKKYWSFIYKKKPKID